MLLCDPCKLLYRKWQGGRGTLGRDKRKGTRDLCLFPLSNWFQKELLKQAAESKSRLSLARWQIPPGAEHRQIIATA
jgi:hypothetical protein